HGVWVALSRVQRIRWRHNRVWITFFESNFQDFDAVPMPAPDVLADEAFQRLEGLGASGGTELLPAAIHVLEKIAVHSAGRRTNVILITDGQMGNEEAIIRAFSSAAQVAVHTFGIDTAVNDAFLKSLARRHRGGCWLQTPDDDIAGTVSALGDRLKRPVLNNVAIAGSWETSDGTLPDLHAREVVTVALRGNAEGPIQITGCLPDGTPHLFTVPLGNEGSEAVKLLWAQQRIEALLASGRKQEAIALAKAHNLICEGAAFIAWDEQEQVAIAKDELVQPAFEPSAGAGGHALNVLFSGRIALHAGGDYPSQGCSSDDTRLFESAPERESDPLEEEAHRKAVLKASIGNLRSMCQVCELPDSITDRFVAWAQSGDVNKRAWELLRVVMNVSAIQHVWASQAALNETIRDLFDGPPESLIAWEKEFQSGSCAFRGLLHALRTLGTFPDTIERLTAWVLESGSFDTNRLNEISRVLESLKRAPHSISATEHQWRQLLAGTAQGIPA
ncbi:MAG: hypothetical protein WCP68_17335, partial [Enhydrobacter sp.]